MTTSRLRMPALSRPQVLQYVYLLLLVPDAPLERERFRVLMARHHYPKSETLVDEQLQYVAKVDGRWAALLS